MLFSALKDADCVDTAGAQRPTFSSLGGLRDRLDMYVDGIAAKAKKESDTAVNRQRWAVLQACRDAAKESPGLFSLTVPTGGGKTLSAMSFALNHAVEHELHRVIVVIPYTRIIEQNARAYRKALGKRNVVEHHSALDPTKETEANKLASENWDAPMARDIFLCAEISVGKCICS
jgi:CRISPR-associated endonuclease/helicase Cas3